MSKRWNAVTLLAVLMVAVMLAAVPAAAEGVAATAAVTVRRVVVSIPDRKLAVIEDGTAVEVYDVAVGKPSTPSPVGTFTIVNRVAHPTYYRPGLVIPAGDRNPLGTRWIGLSEKGYGIHGTSEPASIGYAKSHGCIRLRNADVERLYERLRPGDVVELHAERTPEIEQLFPAS
ncbi:MAG TPA: L,D-transpeptidase [Vicinamibacterales bacterium]|nr:L,D-transpeptidase [Vicinamibacterales bacterium]